MKIRPHFDVRDASFVLLPTISITFGQCEGCGSVAGWMISLDWGFWSAGVVIETINHSH